MALVDLICLANSNKVGGRCVAGLRADGNGWLRPVASDTDHGQLYARHYRFDDKPEPDVLDLIRVDLAEPRPVPGQPENWSLGAGRWVLLAGPIGPKERAVLKSAIVNGPALLGSTGRSIAEKYAGRVSTSLALVAPLWLRWYVSRDMYDRLQARVIFALDGKKYDLPVTDPAWSSRIVRTISEVGQHTNDIIGIPKRSMVWLTVSLSEAFKGACYKLVAGVVVLPGG